MGIVHTIPLKELMHLREDVPISPDVQKQIAQHRKDVRAILEGTQTRALCIVGPCSAWPREAVFAYAKKLAPLARAVEKHVKVVMRVYTQKPRTTKGWAGVVVQPDPFSPPDVARGARYAREMMRSVAELGLPVADEMLFTHKVEWLGDVLSWVAVGARSAEDQEHRVFASSLDVPVGMKNPTSGDALIGINSVLAAQSAHTFFHCDKQVETNGNAYAHLVLRGGTSGPNYDPRTLARVADYMEAHNVRNPAIIVDASHDNSRRGDTKDYRQQVAVVNEVLRYRKKSVRGADLIKGVLVESFMKDGAQSLTANTRETLDTQGCSITDPCLGWEETERLITSLAETW